MAAISSFRVELTSLCRASVVFFAKCGDTMIASNIWPQPPIGKLVFGLMFFLFFFFFLLGVYILFLFFFSFGGGGWLQVYDVVP